MAVLPVQWLSWSSARLLALMLNAMAGLVQFLQRGPAQNLAELDTLLGIRMMQGTRLLGLIGQYQVDSEHLWALESHARGGGFNRGIFQAIHNLSSQMEQLGVRGRELAKKTEAQQFRKFESMLNPKLAARIGKPKLLDEMLRWQEKKQSERNGEANDRRMTEEPWVSWQREDGIKRCVSERLDCCNCSLSSVCSQSLASKGMTGYELTRQVLLFLLLAEQQTEGCDSVGMGDTFADQVDEGGKNNTAFLAERCVNMLDELNKFIQKRRQLARMQIRALGLLSEQVYLCGHTGFVQFANPHLLFALLSWQNPELGCWTADRADPVPEVGIKAAVEFDNFLLAKTNGSERKQQQQQEGSHCLLHISMLAGLALSGVFLRFLLDPGPWPEQHGLRQIVQLEGVPAEDKFLNLPYLKWVHDSDIADPGQRAQLLRPPPSSWSPDLIAFVCLIFVIVLCFVIIIHFCGDEGVARNGGPGRKKMYPYAFKKL